MSFSMMDDKRLKVLGRMTSSNVMKVLWVLHELDLPFIRYDYGGAYGLTDTPEYRAMNPPGLVPTLVEGDSGNWSLWESNAVCRYLARDNPALWPTDPHARAVADCWMDAQQTLLNRPMSTLFWGLVRTAPEDRDPAALEKALQDTARIWRMVEERVAKHDYIAGTSFTLADIPWGVHAHRWFGMNYGSLMRPELPALQAWYDRLCQRKPYQQGVLAVAIS